MGETIFIIMWTIKRKKPLKTMCFNYFFKKCIKILLKFYYIKDFMFLFFEMSL